MAAFLWVMLVRANTTLSDSGQFYNAGDEFNATYDLATATKLAADGTITIIDDTVPPAVRSIEGEPIFAELREAPGFNVLRDAIVDMAEKIGELEGKIDALLYMDNEQSEPVKADGSDGEEFDAEARAAQLSLMKLDDLRAMANDYPEIEHMHDLKKAELVSAIVAVEGIAAMANADDTTDADGQGGEA